MASPMATDLKKSKPWHDPEWRLEHWYYIADKKQNKVLFKRNNIQRRLSLVQNPRKMILKSRQVGVSTQELLKLLDYTMFNYNVTSVILAHEQDAIKKLFRIITRAYNWMDPRFRPRVDRGGGSKHELYFPKINSRIYCDLESRGDTISRLHISEMAFVKDITRVKSTMEAVPVDGGRITMESTPNGMANEFYIEWMNPTSNYAKCFYPWFFHEENFIANHTVTLENLTDDEKKFIGEVITNYNMQITLEQIAWRRFKQNDLKGMFVQENPEDDASCFLMSGTAPFDLAKIKKLYDNAKDPIRVVDGIRIYEEPDPKEVYIICGDPAEGVEGDNSAAHVMKVRNREQVAAFHDNKIKPADKANGGFAEKLIQMADMYGIKWPRPLLGVERNNHGHAVLLSLDQIHNYPNLFKHDRYEKPDELGWKTDMVTRPLMIDTAIEGIENGTVIVRDRQTLAECLTLITQDNGKILAERPNHDDLFIALCIGVQMCIEESKMGIYSDISNKILV